MLNISYSTCDGAESADRPADDSDNFMYESFDSETDCDFQIFQEKCKLHAIWPHVWDRINSHEKTYIQHEVCSNHLCLLKIPLFNFR